MIFPRRKKMFEFDFTFGKEQIVAANRVLTFRPRLALLVAVCAVMLEESIRLHSLLLAGLMFAVAGIVLGIFVLLERISLKNSMSALSGSLDQTVHVTLHETGIKVTMSKPGQYDIHNERDWNAIRAVWESEKYYLSPSLNSIRLQRKVWSRELPQTALNSLK